MRPAWDEVWMGLAVLLSQRSLCENGAGAVAVSADNRTAAPGYAGPPASLSLIDPVSGLTAQNCQAYCKRQRKPVIDRDPGYLDCESIHAEMNCLIHADRTLIKDGTVYISRKPCWTCEKMIRNSGVRRFVYRSDQPRSADGLPGVTVTILREINASTI